MKMGARRLFELFEFFDLEERARRMRDQLYANYESRGLGSPSDIADSHTPHGTLPTAPTNYLADVLVLFLPYMSPQPLGTKLSI
jgi:hypothetical protein